MTWRIHLLCLGLAISLGIGMPYLTDHPRVRSATLHTWATDSSPTELRGVWLTNVGSAVLFVPWGVNRALQQLAQLHFNTVYPVVWNRGSTFYPSSVAKTEIGNSQQPLLGMLRLGQDVLAQIVHQGHQQGLRVIPWFEYGFMTSANSRLAKRHPEWLTYSRDQTKIFQEDWNHQDIDGSSTQVQPLISQGLVNKGVWLNPLHPEVQQFMLDLLVEVVSKYDVAGIQLDDHFSLPVEFGYDPFTIKLYQQEHQGKNPPVNYLDREWMRWRANKITDLMQRVFQAVKAVKSDCVVSLSPNPQYFAYTAYLQDWQTWVQQGWVEELVCQVYRDDLKAFLAELEQPALVLARQKIPVSIGILTGAWNHPIAIPQIQQQVKSVREHGFAGVSFFYWESLWGYITPESPQQRRNAFKALFPTPAKKSIRLSKS